MLIKIYTMDVYIVPYVLGGQAPSVKIFGRGASGPPAPPSLPPPRLQLHCSYVCTFVCTLPSLLTSYTVDAGCYDQFIAKHILFIERMVLCRLYYHPLSVYSLASRLNNQ